jgi:YVTN family beta-propeller protein
MKLLCILGFFHLSFDDSLTPPDCTDAGKRAGTRRKGRRRATMRGKPLGLSRGGSSLMGFLVLSGFVLYPGPRAWAQSVIATVNVGTRPDGVGVNATTNRIYVANRTSNNVSVIDGTNNTVSATVTVGTTPFGVGVNATTNRIYVANTNTNNVSVIDGTNNTVSATTTVGTSPFGVGVNETTTRIYVANFFSNNVSVIQDTPPVIPTLPQWGMMLLTLSLLALATWELAGRPVLFQASATGGTVTLAPSPQLLSSFLVGQGVAAVGLVVYAGLVGPLVPHDAVGGFLAGVLVGVMVECYRRSRSL